MSSPRLAGKMGFGAADAVFGVWFARTNEQRHTNHAGSAPLGTSHAAGSWQTVESKAVKLIGKLPFGGPFIRGQRSAANGKVLGHSSRGLKSRAGRGWPGRSI